MPGRVAIVFVVVLSAGCASQLSTRQELTWDAYKQCQAAGPSSKLDRLDVDGGWSLTGREGEIYRVHACMLEQWQRAAREGRVPALPASSTVLPVKAQAPASQSHVRAARVTDSSTSSSSR